VQIWSVIRVSFIGFEDDGRNKFARWWIFPILLKVGDLRVWYELFYYIILIELTCMVEFCSGQNQF